MGGEVLMMLQQETQECLYLILSDWSRQTLGDVIYIPRNCAMQWPQEEETEDRQKDSFTLLLPGLIPSSLVYGFGKAGYRSSPKKLHYLLLKIQI